MVFSSIGDTTRVSSPQNTVRSGLLATHPLLRPTLSGTSALARPLWGTISLAVCGLRSAPLTNISELFVCQGGAFRFSQTSRTRPEHAMNIREGFKVPHLSRVSGPELLLVDDVMPTGRTVAESVKVFSCAGAKDVWAAMAARTLKNNVRLNLAEKKRLPTW